MGLFWDYFKKTLRFPLIWKPGPLAQLAAGGAESLDQARENILWLRDQFNPDTCDPEYFEAYARSRGIRRHETESEDSFLNRVIYAYAWQLLGGKAAGLPIIYDLYGFSGAVITNLRETDPERWAEFLVELDAPADLDQDRWEAAVWLANEYKPARSKLAGIKITARANGQAPAVKIVFITGHKTTVYPWSIPEIKTNSPVFAATSLGLQFQKITVYPQGE